MSYATAFLQGLKPDPLYTVSEWADAYRVLSQRSSAEPGRWRTARTPYLKEIMDELSPSSPVEEIVFAKSSQVGGSECGNNFIGFVIDHAPGPMMAVLPTVETAKRSSKQRIAPLINESPRLASKVKDARSRDSGNTMLAKEFPGGILILTGANSAVGLRSMPVRYLFLDEVDAYPLDADGEGEPCALAEKRTNTFKARRKIFKVSTPTTEHRSRIQRAFDETDRRRYHVPCPECGAYQVLKFPQLKWERGKPNTARYECSECEAPIAEHLKTDMLSKGKWIAEEPGAQGGRVAGFHINALYSPLGWLSWADIAREWELIQKSKDQERMRTFVNTVLGETWKEKGDAPEWEKLYARRENYEMNKPPRGVLFLTAGVDVQKDRLECHIMGWGLNKESWSIDYRVLMGDTSQPSVWNKLHSVLEEPFQTEDGHTMFISVMAVDSGFQTQTVYDWCRNYPMTRVIAIKGQASANLVIGQPSTVDITVKGRKQKRGFKVWPVGVNMMKSELYGWLKLEAPEEGEDYPAGFFHFPQYDAEFFKQLTAEQLMKKTVKGFAKFEWVKTRERNEGLDCFDSKTEVLTRSGWKLFSLLDGTELIGTVNKDSNLIEFQKPIALIKKHYKGRMIHFKSNRLDFLVTPNHRMWISRVLGVNGKKAWRDWPDFAKAKDVKKHQALKTTANYCGSEEPVIIGGKLCDRWTAARFFGWFLAEGSLARNYAKTQNGWRHQIVISQIKKHGVEKIKSDLKAFPFKLQKVKTGFVFTSKYLYEDLIRYWNRCHDLKVPDWLFDSSPSVISEFLDSFIAGDGWTDNAGHRTCTTVCEHLADQIQALFLLSGKNATKYKRAKEDIRPSWIRGRKVIAKRDQFNISEIRTKRAYLIGKNGDSCIHHVPYDGFVYCATMPNDTLIVRRNGKILITGNCTLYSRAAAAHFGMDRFTEKKWNQLKAGVAEIRTAATAKREAPKKQGIRRRESSWL